MGLFPSSQQPQPPQFQQQGTGIPPSPSPRLGPAYPIWKRQTAIQPAVQPPPILPIMPNTLPSSPVTPLSPLLADPLNATPPPATTAPRTRSRIVAIILLCLLAGGLYFVWHSSSSPASSTNTPNITQQNFSSTSTGNSSNTSSAGTIQVYITGAVKHPGVYTLAQGARVHDLLSAAGGPLPQANLVALNLVAKLSVGQEVYVTVLGETPMPYRLLALPHFACCEHSSAKLLRKGLAFKASSRKVSSPLLHSLARKVRKSPIVVQRYLVTKQTEKREMYS